ncbi:hypothetical protein ACWIUH_01190 [Ursidibacter arcticus]
MEFLFIISILVVITIFLGILSYNINVKKRGVRDFIISTNKYKKFLLNIFIYIVVIIYSFLHSTEYHYKVEDFVWLVIPISYLIYDINSEMSLFFDKVRSLFPSLFLKVLLISFSTLVFILINDYVSRVIGINLGSFSITFSSITFLFSLMYLGTFIMLFVALFIEFKLLFLMLKIERVKERFIQFIYNALSDKSRIYNNIENNQNNESFKNILIYILRIFLIMLILDVNRKFINEPEKLIEEIVLLTSYTSKPIRCDNIPDGYNYKVMFLNIEQVSLAKPIIEKNAQNFGNYEFTIIECKKNDRTNYVQ